MALKSEIKQDFVTLLGADNFSDAEPIRHVYAYNWCIEIMNVTANREPNGFYYLPEAVALPKTVEEVQQLVILCNKYGLKFKAQSTGFGPWNQPGGEGTVIVDLRRMNRIILIDPLNHYAVVEPYVSGAQLQAELMKYGLNCHMPGAGPQVSPLASATSMAGPGFTSSETSHSERNVLGTEWVLPNGEILRLGSWGLDHTPSWFSGDGPGPSLRGIMRGTAGTKSGLGIFTKVAVKLYPFPCEPKWEMTGTSPYYEMNVPKYLQYHILDYKTLEAFEKGIERIEEEEICFMCYHTSVPGMVTTFSNTMGAFIKNMIKNLFTKNPLIILIAATTKREFDYKEMVIKALVKETGAKDLVASKRFVPTSLAYAEALRSHLGFHGFMVGTSFQSTHGPMETFAMCRKMMEANIPLKKQFIKKRVISNDLGKGVWSSSFEHGHFYHAEMPTMYEQTDLKSVKGMTEYMQKCNELDMTKHLGVPFFIEGDEMHDWFGPSCMNYQVWMRKIKEALDPHNTADPGFYISSRIEK